MSEEIIEMNEKECCGNCQESKIEESDFLILENDDTIKIFGTSEQRISMFNDWALYFGEVENPDNTTLNTFFKAKYAPLNEVLNTIRPIMSKYGLSIIQVPFTSNGDPSLKSIVTHRDGAVMSLPIVTSKPSKNDIQGFGSTISYLRRFVVNGIAGVMGEVDDDGNSGKSGKSETPKSTTQTPEEPKADYKKQQQKIVDLITELGGSKNEDVMKIVKEKISTGNPFKLNDKSKLNELETDLKNYKKEKEVENNVPE